MAPFDFNYVQDDLLNVATAPQPVYVQPAHALNSAEILRQLRPQPSAAALQMSRGAHFYPNRDAASLRIAAAGRAALATYDTHTNARQENSYAEMVLEFLDKKASLTSVFVIFCYIELLRSF